VPSYIRGGFRNGLIQNAEGAFRSSVKRGEGEKERNGEKPRGGGRSMSEKENMILITDVIGVHHGLLEEKGDKVWP